MHSGEGVDVDRCEAELMLAEESDGFVVGIMLVTVPLIFPQPEEKRRVPSLTEWGGCQTVKPSAEEVGCCRCCSGWARRCAFAAQKKRVLNLAVEIVAWRLASPRCTIPTSGIVSVVDEPRLCAAGRTIKPFTVWSVHMVLMPAFIVADKSRWFFTISRDE